MTKEGLNLWTPSEKTITQSNISLFMRWIESKRDIQFDGDYETLHRWSVDCCEDFWGDCWEYFGIISDTPFKQVLNSRNMENAKWFEGAKVNYAEHLLRGGADDDVVIVHMSEARSVQSTTRAELRKDVRVLATQLRKMGVVSGDTVVSYMPNVAETVVAFLATVSIGAVWSSAAPEFGVSTVLDRFSQIEPKVMFAVDGYRYGGKDFDRCSHVAKIAEGMPSIEHLVWLPFLNKDAKAPTNTASYWDDLINQTDPGKDEFHYARVSHDHPLWVVYSSGTTGLPKPIVHSHIGVLIEAYVVLQLHFNLRPGRRLFFHTTTGWIMWNITMAGLCTGASIVLFDGNPNYPSTDFLWHMADKFNVSHFGTSPTFLESMASTQVKPKEFLRLENLDSVILSGSPASPELFDWIYQYVKEDLWVASVSGGTEIAGGFVGPVPILPVKAGEIQCRILGKDVYAWNESGEPIVDEVGELVCCNPFPSMPVGFWGDDQRTSYLKTYFDYFKGVWRHGDFIKVTSEGGCYVYGRSDSSINRHGVRVGTGEIYSALEKMDGISDSLVVCYQTENGSLHMPLFVKLEENIDLDREFIEEIKSHIRTECSPRHVPDMIYQVEKIPYTLTGKKMEIPVKKILMGGALESVVNLEAMMDPSAIYFFTQFHS